ncbi:putative holin-like toxin [Bacillus velezensis]|uniref:putative holin-like toxin n=1 Tax=Bacillus velezensis TaxID=492670 RepID=UPI00320AC26E
MRYKECISPKERNHFPFISVLVYNIDIVQMNALKVSGYTLLKGGVAMTTYQAISLMIAFGTFTVGFMAVIVALLSLQKKK